MKKRATTITEEHLTQLRTFIQKHTGLFFPESRIREKFKDISELCLASGHSTLSKFILFLSTRSGESCLKKIKALFLEEDLLFFHTSPCLEALKHNILPEILKKNSSTGNITIWSAGCSTGEEPYIAAFFLHELLGDEEDWKITIIGTDIDRKALKTAREGKYPKWAFRGVDRKIIEKYFTRESEYYLIKARYRKMVHFSFHNLQSSVLPAKITKTGGADLILFRNVSTLLDAKTTRKMAGTFYRILNKNGFLLTGRHEHSKKFYSKLSPRFFPESMIYQKSKVSARTANRPSRPPDDHNVDPIDLVIENETTNLLTIIKENDLSRFKAKEELSLHENRKGRSKKTEETLIFDLAISCFNEKKYDGAIEAFVSILDINNQNTRAYWMLCHIYAMKGLYDEAIEWGTRCIEIDPLNRAPYYTLALSYIGKGRLNDAAEKIKKAIYIDPKFTLGYFTLGNIYILLHLKSQADNITERAELLSCSTLSKELSGKTKSISVKKLLDELQLKPRSFQEES